MKGPEITITGTVTGEKDLSCKKPVTLMRRSRFMGATWLLPGLMA